MLAGVPRRAEDALAHLVWDLLGVGRERVVPAVQEAMRPNIDIDWATHGQIKDYAEANDMNLSEAYAEVLEAGLETLETHNQQ